MNLTFKHERDFKYNSYFFKTQSRQKFLATPNFHEKYATFQVNWHIISKEKRESHTLSNELYDFCFFFTFIFPIQRVTGQSHFHLLILRSNN